MKIVKYLLTLFIVILTGCSINTTKEPGQKYADSPIIGSWVYSVGGCDETYQFLPSGIRNSTSNREIVRAKYAIETLSPEKRIYKIRDEVIGDNGLKDCSGSTSDMTGDVVEVYVMFADNPERLRFCFDKELTRCVGPFVKNK